MSFFNIEKYEKVLNSNYIKQYGKIIKVIGLTIESAGPAVKLGEICKVWSSKDVFVYAEVVGFKDSNILLMPIGELEGIALGSKVEATGKSLMIEVGDNLLGRVLNGLGNPIDDLGDMYFTESYPVRTDPPNPLKRKPITQELSLGVKAIDGLLTIGKGQRVGIFAGSGVGKSTLLGMIARNTKSDINIIALIGERGREVRDFIEKSLGEEGMKRSVLIVSTSDQPALLRLKAAQTATAIAEYFRDKGKNVLLMMDSLTRFSMAQREIGLAVGEPPVSKGYTPSVFSVMPKLLERAGNSDIGSITGLYTVLVDGDDMNEPIADTARGILDGHIVLSRELAHQNHFPAIDIMQSISRVMNDIISMEHRKNCMELKNLLATYKKAEDLINIGAYVKGSNNNIDLAIEKIDSINEFLLQEVDEKIDYEQVKSKLENIFQIES